MIYCIIFVNVHVIPAASISASVLVLGLSTSPDEFLKSFKGFPSYNPIIPKIIYFYIILISFNTRPVAPILPVEDL